MDDPIVKKEYCFSIESDDHPIPYKVVRGETVFARCRDVGAAQALVQWYTEHEKLIGGVFPYE